jgi:hypothetical protein
MTTLERQKKKQDELSITMERDIASAWERIAEAERKASAQAIADSEQKNELSPDDDDNLPKAQKRALQRTIFEARGAAAGVEIAERRAKIAALLQEEKRVKQEIARLDFMVYGRSGKYQKWRNL